MGKDKKLEIQSSEVKTAEDIANEILLQHEIDKAEVVELSKKLFVLKSQIEQETELLERIKEKSKNLSADVKKTKEDAEIDANNKVQDAKQEAQSILLRAERDAKEKRDEIKSSPEKQEQRQ